MCWWEQREAQTLIYCWKKYRRVWSLWEKLWQILLKLNMHLYSSPRHRWRQWLSVVWVSSFWGKDEDFKTDRYVLFTWNIDLFLLIFRNFNMLYCSFAKLCPTLCNSLDCSTPGSPVVWSLLGFMCFKSVMLSHPLPPPYPFVVNLYQHDRFSGESALFFFFFWVSSSYQVAKVLKLQRQSFQWIFRVDFL